MWNTSSLNYSTKIGSILDAPHFDCKRIEWDFNIKNCTKLKPISLGQEQ